MQPVRKQAAQVQHPGQVPQQEPRARAPVVPQAADEVPLDHPHILRLPIVEIELVDRGGDHRPRTSERGQPAPVTAPAETLHGGPEQVLVARLPAIRQQGHHAALEQEPGIHVDQALAFERLLQPGLHFLVGPAPPLRQHRAHRLEDLAGRGFRGPGGGLPERGRIAGAMARLARGGQWWLCGENGFSGRGWLGGRGCFSGRGWFCARLLLRLFLLAVGEPLQGHFVRLAQGLETAGVLLLVDLLEQPRVGTADRPVVRRLVEAEVGEERRRRAAFRAHGSSSARTAPVRSRWAAWSSSSLRALATTRPSWVARAPRTAGSAPPATPARRPATAGRCAPHAPWRCGSPAHRADGSSTRPSPRGARRSRLRSAGPDCLR